MTLTQFYGVETLVFDVMGVLSPELTKRVLTQDFLVHGPRYYQHILTTQAQAHAEQRDLVSIVAAEAGIIQNDPQQIALEIVKYVVNQLKGGVVTGEYLALIGHVAHQAYEQVRFTGAFFPDVAPAFAKWQQLGLTICLYSHQPLQEQSAMLKRAQDVDVSALLSGKLLPTGDVYDLSGFVDMRFCVSGYEDKYYPSTYQQLASTLNSSPSCIVFFSDKTKELDAAAGAGFHGVLVMRPGNDPQPAHTYPIISSLKELEIHPSIKGESKHGA